MTTAPSCPYCRRPVSANVDHPNTVYAGARDTSMQSSLDFWACKNNVKEGALTNHLMAYCASCDVWLVLEKLNSQEGRKP